MRRARELKEHKNALRRKSVDQRHKQRKNKAKVKALVLLHLSQRYDAIPQVILKEAKSVFESVIVPEDFDGLEF